MERHEAWCERCRQRYEVLSFVDGQACVKCDHQLLQLAKMEGQLVTPALAAALITRGWDVRPWYASASEQSSGRPKAFRVFEVRDAR